MSDTPTDPIDHELLELLRLDGRATYSEMAGKVGLSIAAVKRRVDRLRTLGVITGFTVQVDQAKLGRSVAAFTEIRYAGTMTPEEMLAGVAKVPEVQAVFTIAGDPDVLVELRARDHAHLQEVINQLRRSGRAIGTKTLIVLGSWHRDA